MVVFVISVDSEEEVITLGIVATVGWVGSRIPDAGAGGTARRGVVSIQQVIHT